MTTNWQNTFRKRMNDFKIQQKHDEHGIAISIKIRVVSGCYHRSCSPLAYKIIDQYLEKVVQNEDFSFEEHESGPEILVYIAAATAGISFAKSIIDLIVTIFKARSESVRQGDHRDSPLELIVRRSFKNGEFREEKILRIGPRDEIKRQEIEEGLNRAIETLTSEDDN